MKNKQIETIEKDFAENKLSESEKLKLQTLKVDETLNDMDNKIIKMQVEILDLNKIEQYKEMLKKDSISYYEDFLLDNIVFIEVENKIKTEIEKDSRFEVHMGHIAYQM